MSPVSMTKTGGPEQGHGALPSNDTRVVIPTSVHTGWGPSPRSVDKGGAEVVGGSFTHLHLHTEFSMLDGAARVNDVVAAAAADGQPAIGITDHGNMYGVLDFYKACRGQGVNPVIGTEAYMAADSVKERPTIRGRVDDTGGDAEGGQKAYYHLILLAETNEGYRNLLKASSA